MAGKQKQGKPGATICSLGLLGAVLRHAASRRVQLAGKSAGGECFAWFARAGIFSVPHGPPRRGPNFTGRS
eukprot:15463723-Alexandrium_andersonii.AAC.1